MRGDKYVSTSRLTFATEYKNELVFPAMPIASFVPPEMTSGGGQPFPNATLEPGRTDLTRISLDPSAFRLLWSLSAGVMATPGRAVLTGAPNAFVDLVLSMVTSSLMVGDQKPGSVLFFSRYTSSASNPAREDTQINLTNSSPVSAAYVRIFLVNGSSCSPLSLDVSLNPQQAISFLASDVDPGVKGYVVAVAINQQGQPVQLNSLIGNAIVRQPATNLGGTFTTLISAMGFARRLGTDVPNVNGLAELIFDDVNYDRLPSQVSFDSVSSQASAINLTSLSVFRPIRDLRGGSSVVPMQVTAWGQGTGSTTPTSGGTISNACYTDVAVGSLRLTPISVAQLLPAGTAGWVSVTPTDSLPVLGVYLNSGSFNGGGNARPIFFSNEYRMTIPVTPFVVQ